MYRVLPTSCLGLSAGHMRSLVPGMLFWVCTKIVETTWQMHHCDLTVVGSYRQMRWASGGSLPHGPQPDPSSAVGPCSKHNSAASRRAESQADPRCGACLAAVLRQCRAPTLVQADTLGHR